MFTLRKIGIVAVLVAIAAAVLYVLLYGVRPGPSFIARLQSGQIVSQDIARLEILRLDPGNGWPFNERDYAKLERVTISERSTVESILSVLRADCTAGIQHHNHPTTHHYGILRVQLQSAEYFYLYYTIHSDQSGDFASIKANSANSTNPNGASDYESTKIVSLLQHTDLWFPRK